MYKRFYDGVRYSLPCCPNCEHYSTSILAGNQAREYCTLDEAQNNPPAKIIAFGCHRFSLDVPF